MPAWVAPLVAGAGMGVGLGAANALFRPKPPAPPTDIFHPEEYIDPETGEKKVFDRGKFYQLGGTERWAKDRRDEAFANAGGNALGADLARQRGEAAYRDQEYGMGGIRSMVDEQKAFLRGERKSLAEEQMAYGLTQANQNAAAMAGSARGYGGGMAALRGAQMAQQQQTSDALGMGAMLRAKEEESARQQLANLYQQDFANRFQRQQISDAEKSQYDSMVQYWRNQGLDVAKAEMLAYDLMNQRVLENLGLQTTAASEAFKGETAQYGANMQFMGSAAATAGRLYQPEK